jgi:hypothetical protein
MHGILFYERMETEAYSSDETFTQSDRRFIVMIVNT